MIFRLSRRALLPFLQNKSIQLIQLSRFSTSIHSNQRFNHFDINKYIEDLIQTDIKSSTVITKPNLLPQSLKVQLEKTKDPHLKLQRILDYQKPLRIGTATLEHYLLNWFQVENLLEALTHLSNPLILKLLSHYAIHGAYEEIARIYLHVFNDMKVELKSANAINSVIIESLVMSNDLKYGLIELLCEIHKALAESDCEHLFRFYFHSLVANNLILLENCGFKMSFQQFETFLFANEQNSLNITHGLIEKMKQDALSGLFDIPSYLNLIEKFQLYENGLITRICNSVHSLRNSSFQEKKEQSESFILQLLYQLKKHSNAPITLSSRSLMKISKCFKSYKNFKSLLVLLSQPSQSDLINYHLRNSLTQHKGNTTEAIDMILNFEDIDLIDNAILIELILRESNKELFDNIWTHYSKKSLLMDTIMIKASASQLKRIMQWRGCNITISNLERLLKNSRKFSSQEEDFVVLLENVVKSSGTISTPSILKVFTTWENFNNYRSRLLAAIINYRTTTDQENILLRDEILRSCHNIEELEMFLVQVAHHRKTIFLNLVFRRTLTKSTLQFARDIAYAYPSRMKNEALYAFKVSLNQLLEEQDSKRSETFQEVWNKLIETPNSLNSSTLKKLKILQKNPYMERKIIMKIMENSFKFASKKKSGSLQLDNERMNWCITRARELNIPTSSIKQLIHNSGIDLGNTEQTP